VIAILDVCSGNLRSVERALVHVGADVQVTRDPDVVRKADKLVVPGQGAFGVFMRGLAERGLGEVLREQIARGTPYLGICLGLQILFERSDEGGGPGLGVLRGNVTRLEPGDARLKIPHMGWNPIRARQPVPGLADGDHVYFVHSYKVEPVEPAVVAIEATHGVTFCAGIRKDNLLAVQFHPEKSQATGLRMLREFVAAGVERDR
jgi:glutamine amidotransferase